MVQWLKNLPPKHKGRSSDPSTGVNDRWSRWPARGRWRWGILGTNCIETSCCSAEILCLNEYGGELRRNTPDATSSLHTGNTHSDIPAYHTHFAKQIKQAGHQHCFLCILDIDWMWPVSSDLCYHVLKPKAKRTHPAFGRCFFYGNKKSK